MSAEVTEVREGMRPPGAGAAGLCPVEEQCVSLNTEPRLHSSLGLLAGLAYQFASLVRRTSLAGTKIKV